jgi:hypothetical protein
MTIRRRRSITTANVEDLQRFYRRVLPHNLSLGWWGVPFGLVWTPMALVQNSRARSRLAGLMSGIGAAPGWYQDPTGHHHTRYWDGRRWTDRVGGTQVSTDPPEPAR